MESFGEDPRILRRTIKTCAKVYAKDPFDANCLKKWASALLKLMHHHTLDRATPMLMGLAINPSKADALWLLGNAHTDQGIYCCFDRNIAKQHFAHATACFQRAVELEPSNDKYKESLESSPTTSLIRYSALHKTMDEVCHLQDIFTVTGNEINKISLDMFKRFKKKKDINQKYAVCGGTILAVVLLAWFGMLKSRPP